MGANVYDTAGLFLVQTGSGAVIGALAQSYADSRRAKRDLQRLDKNEFERRLKELETFKAVAEDRATRPQPQGET